MNRKRRLATLAAMLGNGIFGFSFMFSSIALEVARPFVMLMYRFLLAFLVLSAVALYSHRTGKFQGGEDGQIHFLRFNLSGKKLAPLLLMGLIQPVAYFLCESYGISLTNATLSGVIIALIPIAALVGGFLVLGERPRKLQIMFSLVSIAGVVLMTLQQQEDGQIHLSGVLLLIGAVLTGAAFNIFSRKISTGYSALERTYIMMLVGAVTFMGLAVWQCRQDMALLFQPLQEVGFLLSILYLGIFSSIVAFMCLNYANNELPVAKTTAFCNLTTVISLFAGVLFLGEPFNLVSLVASVLIIVGIWGVQRSR